MTFGGKSLINKEIKMDRVYKCNTCGHLYEDAKESVKFEDLAEDWKCPVCGVDKSFFTELT